VSKMKYFNDVKQLADELMIRKVCSKKFLIGIDGFLGAGKTRLADNLLKILDTNCVNVIDIDDEEKNYYPRNKGSITKNIDFIKLKNDIINIQTSVIFSSTCLMQILEKIGISLDVYVYIKRMAKYYKNAPDIWLDEDDCTFMGDVNEWEEHEISKALKLNNQINPFDVKKQLLLTKEVIQYHQKYQPYKNPEYFYSRYEE